MSETKKSQKSEKPTIEQQIVNTYAVLGECHTRKRQAEQVIKQMVDTINNHEKHLLHLMDQQHPEKAE